jgi:hypothetical protein
MTLLCLCFGGLLSLHLHPNAAIAQSAPGPVDPVTPTHQAGQRLYLETCATCHIALPPAVFPTQTWQMILPDQEHYGATLPPIGRGDQRLIWNYLSTYSRPLRNDETTPFRLGQARHFKALHPQVKLPQRITAESCASCHPRANVFDFRSLSPEWQ